jgi:hypothetical protein
MESHQPIKSLNPILKKNKTTESSTIKKEEMFQK